MCPIYNIAQSHDISIYLDKQEEAIAMVEAWFNDIGLWMQQNKLKLNENKSELIAITPTQHSHPIKISNCTVESSTTAKKLSAIFDDSMNLHEQ